MAEMERDFQAKMKAHLKEEKNLQLAALEKAKLLEESEVAIENQRRAQLERANQLVEQAKRAEEARRQLEQQLAEAKEREAKLEVENQRRNEALRLEAQTNAQNMKVWCEYYATKCQRDFEAFKRTTEANFRAKMQARKDPPSPGPEYFVIREKMKTH